LWAYAVIFCGHFPDGAEKFTVDQFENETQGEWYLRQMLGSANFDAGPVMAFMSGNLSYQIEHHLFPDIPSNRYTEVSVKVQELCDKYDLPYTTGSLGKQYLLAFRTIHKLALPDQWLKRTSDDAPETSSERKFAGISLPSMPTWNGSEWLAEHSASEWLAEHQPRWGLDPETGERRGLRSAMQEAKVALKEKAAHEKQVLREAKAALQEKARTEKAAFADKAQRGGWFSRKLRRNR
ncbi:fatty acid desaturase family protein, partial [Streptomyces sp. NPDC059083]|uniref:fatty acid desaturase family protein n=1 Tax=Streptomyces sp. NPDC059083 TaxID=3346721 RepID=UPI0036B17BAF